MNNSRTSSIVCILALVHIYKILMMCGLLTTLKARCRHGPPKATITNEV